MHDLNQIDKSTLGYKPPWRSSHGRTPIKYRSTYINAVFLKFTYENRYQNIVVYILDRNLINKIRNIMKSCLNVCREVRVLLPHEDIYQFCRSSSP